MRLTFFFVIALTILPTSRYPSYRLPPSGCRNRRRHDVKHEFANQTFIHPDHIPGRNPKNQYQHQQAAPTRSEVCTYHQGHIVPSVFDSLTSATTPPPHSFKPASPALSPSFNPSITQSRHRRQTTFTTMVQVQLQSRYTIIRIRKCVLL